MLGWGQRRWLLLAAGLLLGTLALAGVVAVQHPQPEAITALRQSLDQRTPAETNLPLYPTAENVVSDTSESPRLLVITYTTRIDSGMFADFYFNKLSNQGWTCPPPGGDTLAFVCSSERLLPGQAWYPVVQLFWHWTPQEHSRIVLKQWRVPYKDRVPLYPNAYQVQLTHTKYGYRYCIDLCLPLPEWRLFTPDSQYDHPFTYASSYLAGDASPNVAAFYLKILPLTGWWIEASDPNRLFFARMDNAGVGEIRIDLRRRGTAETQVDVTEGLDLAYAAHIRPLGLH